MKKIVQLENHEYENLVELAQINKQKIEEKALKLWNEKGVAEIRITIDSGHDYDDEYKITASSYMMYKDSKFYIPETLRIRFRKIINEVVNDSISKKFGNMTQIINIYNGKVSSLNRIKFTLMAIAASGWAAAATLFVLS